MVGIHLHAIQRYFKVPPHMFAWVEVRKRLCDVRTGSLQYIFGPNGTYRMWNGLRWSRAGLPIPTSQVRILLTPNFNALHWAQMGRGARGKEKENENSKSKSNKEQKPLLFQNA